MNELQKRNENEIQGISENVSAMRELQRVQAQVLLAKKFPRTKKDVFDKIERACTSLELASQALYEYSRGGTNISGPSIRLMEVVAQCYGNLDCGVVELSQDEGESTFQAFAWDMESNVRIEKTFSVRHVRYSKSGITDLKDPRDIYETVANNASRRLRACLQSIIPKDFVQLATDEVTKTLKAKVQVTDERLKKMVELFKVFKIEKEDIEDYIGSRLEAMTPSMFMKLTRIYKSLEDEIAVKEDFFKPKEKANSEVITVKSDPVQEKTPEPEKKFESKNEKTPEKEEMTF